MSENMQSPWIVLEGAFNVRDTGGYPAEGGTIRLNALLRADSLHKLTAADQEILMERGLRTVIDLRGASEVSVAANVFANSETVAYHSLPVIEGDPGASGADVDLATIYRYMVDSCQPGLLRALQAIANAPEGATLIHCSAGKDRTGITTALALGSVGVPREYIVADYILTTVAMERLRPRLLGEGDLPPEARAHIEKLLASTPELINDLLDYIDTQYGGIDAYLTQIGLSPAHRDLLRARLVQPHEEITNG